MLDQEGTGYKTYRQENYLRPVWGARNANSIRKRSRDHTVIQKVSGGFRQRKDLAKDLIVFA